MFSHEYHDVNDEASDQYIVDTINIKKRFEGGADCYWVPVKPGQDARLTYKYTFDRPVVRASLNARINTYNFGGGRTGVGSLWVSKDGRDWVKIIDAPTPQKVDAPPFKAEGALPEEVIGGREIWVQARLRAEGWNIMVQFQRAHQNRDKDKSFYAFKAHFK